VTFALAELHCASVFNYQSSSLGKWEMHMKTRRSFLSRTSALGVAAALAGTTAAARKADRAPPHKLKRVYGSHFGMFKESAGTDPIAQLEFMSAQGFMALEDNGLMGRPVEMQQRIGEALTRLGMTMGVFVIDGGDNWKTSLTTGLPEFRDKFLETCRTAIEVAKRVNARWATVVPGYFERKLPLGIQMGHVIDTLRAGAAILAPHNLTMVLEPLSDNPDLFLRTSDQAFAICRAVDSPVCKILYDMYHMQRNEGDIIQHVDLAWSEIAYFQIGDNPGRKEPGTGEMNYGNIFGHITSKGYTGVFGMEHGNSKPGKAGEQALIDAYVAADSF
jgi:hydroxypyruvate isomerase